MILFAIIKDNRLDNMAGGRLTKYKLLPRAAMDAIVSNFKVNNTKNVDNAIQQRIKRYRTAEL